MATARGGARPRAGRPSSQPGDFVTLPAEGRFGPTPEWPLTQETEREAFLWENLWTKPQAVAWETSGNSYEVALFVRYLTEAETPGALAGLRTLVRQLQDSLGLSTPGMRANKWRLSTDADDDDDIVDSADNDD